MKNDPYWEGWFELGPDQLKREDGGMALIAEDLEPISVSGPGADGRLFLRLQSWADDARTPADHAGLCGLAGKRFRIRIELE